MFRTLSELRDSINSMIESQGENAPCAAFVFTQHDVFEYNDDGNQEEYFSSLFTQDVLADVGGSSYIYEQVGEMIDDAISLRKKLPLYANWIMNRSELQDLLIQNMLDDMDLKTMTQLCYDYLDEGYAKYSDEELITECEEYYPELLENA
jgi:hypothetical protein